MRTAVLVAITAIALSSAPVLHLSFCSAAEQPVKAMPVAVHHAASHADTPLHPHIDQPR
ncbi:MAG TPA: hypothetical protein VN151_11535 [Terracidiphilus sp.]|nr:hypothetical protein [Terracidiphilus sp.]